MFARPSVGRARLQRVNGFRIEPEKAATAGKRLELRSTLLAQAREPLLRGEAFGALADLEYGSVRSEADMDESACGHDVLLGLSEMLQTGPETEQLDGHILGSKQGLTGKPRLGADAGDLVELFIFDALHFGDALAAF